MIGLDLFAGAGGMSLGAKKAGIDVRCAVERDPVASQTYARNHATATLFIGDIKDFRGDILQRHRRDRDELVVFGGPPCQGFSWSNPRSRNRYNPSNWLFEEYLRVVRTLKPAWTVFENVQGIVDTASGEFLEKLIVELEKDYVLWKGLLNAKSFGVPQDRTRFFLVGTRTGVGFNFPEARPRSLVTVDDAIRDLPYLTNGAALCYRGYGKARPSKYGTRMRGFLKGCSNHLVTRNAEYVIERYRHIPQGGNWQHIPASLMANYKDYSRCHTGTYHRLLGCEPSVVIGNYRKSMLIHPTQDRGLSVREAARIQSFPDSYVFLGSIGFQQQQVGNAVPPLLATAVFCEIVRTADRQQNSR